MHHILARKKKKLDLVTIGYSYWHILIYIAQYIHMMSFYLFIYEFTLISYEFIDNVTGRLRFRSSQSNPW